MCCLQFPPHSLLYSLQNGSPYHSIEIAFLKVTSVFHGAKSNGHSPALIFLSLLGTTATSSKQSPLSFGDIAQSTWPGSYTDFWAFGLGTLLCFLYPFSLGEFIQSHGFRYYLYARES